MKSTVVIVDDSKAIHELVAAALADDGYDLKHALDGTSGLAMVAAAKPDLILLDVDLPDANGFDVCATLKQNPATAKIGVIFLTASASADDRVRGLALASVDYIVKPFDPRELSLRMRTAMRNARMSSLLDVAGLGDHEAADNTASHGIPKLRLGQVILARSHNPWRRVPPPQPAQKGPTA